MIYPPRWRGHERPGNREDGGEGLSSPPLRISPLFCTKADAYRVFESDTDVIDPDASLSMSPVGRPM